MLPRYGLAPDAFLGSSVIGHRRKVLGKTNPGHALSAHQVLRDGAGGTAFSRCLYDGAPLLVSARSTRASSIRCPRPDKAPLPLCPAGAGRAASERGRGRSGRIAATKVPDPCLRSMNPLACNWSNASSTVILEMERSRARVREDGSRSPATNRSSRMRSRRRV